MKRLVAMALLLAPLVGSTAWAAGTSVTSQKLTVDAPTVCSLTPDADTYIAEASSGTNFGTETGFSVTSLLLGNQHGLVRFDLSTCAIPADATVLSADLTLHLSTAPSLARMHAGHRVTEAWSETSVTWDDQPSAATTATATISTGTTDGVTRTLDVTSDVADFVAGTAVNEGWSLEDTLEGDAVGMTGTYSSREHATTGEHPVLAVTYR